jgi:hypothetical protein
LLNHSDDHRDTLGVPLQALGASYIDALNHVINIAIQNPRPLSTGMFPTDNEMHWVSWYTTAAAIAPRPAIRDFIAFLQFLAVVGGGCGDDDDDGGGLPRIVLTIVAQPDIVVPNQPDDVVRIQADIVEPNQADIAVPNLADNVAPNGIVAQSQRDIGAPNQPDNAASNDMVASNGIVAQSQPDKVAPNQHDNLAPNGIAALDSPGIATSNQPVPQETCVPQCCVVS